MVLPVFLSAIPSAASTFAPSIALRTNYNVRESLILRPLCSKRLPYFFFARVSTNVLRTMSSSGANSPELKPSDFEYLTRVEYVLRYEPGGYHPVRIGDSLNERYSIVHKLGYGSYSTVWLARDAVDGSYKAVKILTSYESTEDNSESRILRLLSFKMEAHAPDAHPLLTLLDEFMISGPNGTHRCLVTQVAGCSIVDSSDRSVLDFFSMPVARMIVTQIVLAVRFMHRQGVVHGDLHAGNILIQLPSVDGLTVDELYHRLGSPRTQDVKLSSGKPLSAAFPPYEVENVFTGLYVPCERVTTESCRIRVCDFGEAYLAAETKRFRSHAPMPMAPPESIFEAPDQALEYSSDIWTLACTIFEVFSNHDLFDCPWFGNRADGMIEDFVNMLGYESMPSAWAARWSQRDKYVDADGKWTHEDDKPRSITKRVEKIRKRAHDNFSAEERECFVSMLESMLKFKPEERITAEELVHCRWMEQWGIPAIQEGNAESA